MSGEGESGHFSNFSESLVVKLLFGKSSESFISWSGGLPLPKSYYDWRWAMYISPNLD